MDFIASAATRNYIEARPATAALPDSGEGVAGLAATFSQIMDHADQTARSAMAGGASPHALVEALASAETAVITVMTVRDKVVEAYQEIMRMPV